jgi:predicted Zn-dependent protease
MLHQSPTRAGAARSLRKVRPCLEQLESRFVPYSVSGGFWIHPELVTISFVPDGTVLTHDSQGQPVTSTLLADFDARWARSTWQNAILKGAQVWARQTNLNLAVVADNGAPIGYTASLQQGDPSFGDIRIGGAQFTDRVGLTFLAQAYMPQALNNYSLAGDIQFNTDSAFNIGATYDLFTVAAHEFGHALGLNHGDTGTVMAATYPGLKSDLSADDTNGIRSIYSAGLARSADVYDTGSNNNSFGAATNVPIDAVSKTALVTGLDITTSTDSDYFKVTIPSGTSGTLKVVVQSAGLSQLAPKLYVYNSAYVQKGFANGTGQYGTTLTVNVTAVSAGQVYYIKVVGADTSSFGTGKYALVVNTGTGADPIVPLPVTATVNGDPIHSGGGSAQGEGDQYYADGHDHDGHDHDGQDGDDAGTIGSGVKDKDKHARVDNEGTKRRVRKDGSHETAAPNLNKAKDHVWEAYGKAIAADEAGPLAAPLLSPLKKLRRR